MSKKRLIPCIYLEDEKSVELAQQMNLAGADALLIFDVSETEQEHEEALSMMKKISKAIEIPMICGGNIKRVEDVKKLLYAGADKVILDFSKESNQGILEEASKRFGKEKIAVSLNKPIKDENQRELVAASAGTILSFFEDDIGMEVPVIQMAEEISEKEMAYFLGRDSVCGISSISISDGTADFRELKRKLREKNIPVCIPESSIPWSSMKLNADGMIPVIAQDYKTDQVLMMAYMNEEAFDQTIETGRMTYWSRSRNELWVKGLTSGHFQYVKSLSVDCDLDTILAKVSQVGAACHTGHKSCFYRDLLTTEDKTKNPMKVFEDVYAVIEDRKLHPKEGSYTNYLFDKGIDKILKKVGEESSEIIIAAKNPNREEVKYEISDLLYHLMVLMAECEVTWEDIVEELAQR